jgi:hypothetical protein
MVLKWVDFYRSTDQIREGKKAERGCQNSKQKIPLAHKLYAISLARMGARFRKEIGPLCVF